VKFGVVITTGSGAQQLVSRSEDFRFQEPHRQLVTGRAMELALRCLKS
jgi:hypothetical protein